MATAVTRVTKFINWLNDQLSQEQDAGAPVNVLGVRVDQPTDADSYDFDGDPTAEPDRPDFVKDYLKGWRKL